MDRCLYELPTPLLSLQYAAMNDKRALARLLVTSAIRILARRDDPYQTIIFISSIEQVVDKIVLEGNCLLIEHSSPLEVCLMGVLFSRVSACADRMDASVAPAVGGWMEQE